MYKIVGTTIKVQTDAGLVELESITGPSPESREALDTFFQKWKILSIDTTIKQKISVPIIEHEKPKPERRKSERKFTCGFSPQERKEIALSKLPELFTIMDWLKVFESTAMTKEERGLLKKNYAYDIKCLLKENKIVLIGKEGIIHKFRILEKTTSQKEKEDSLKKVNEERKAFEGTFR